MDLKIRDVADLLNVSETTIRSWISDGKIPTYSINQDHYFSRTEMEEFIGELTKTSGASPLANHQEAGERSPKKRGSKQFSLFRAIHKGEVLYDIKGKTKEEIIRTTMRLTAKTLHMDDEIITDLLLEREALMPTALNNGIAVPHTRESLLNIYQDVIIVVFLNEPLDYGALDGQPVHTLFFLFACDDKRHLHLLAKIAHLSSQPNALELFQTKPSKEKLLTFIKEWESQIPSR